MSQELFYTSAPRGLYPGTSGFCVVAATQGMSPVLVEKLERLSEYRHLFPPLDPRNPIGYSHTHLKIGGQTLSVLSRVSDARLEYSGRSNKFAHHVVLAAGELPPGGPAWLLSQPGFVETAWDGEVRQLPAGRKPPTGDTAAAVCRHWQQLTGDAGWAGWLAEAFDRDPGQPVYLLFHPGMELLPLFVEAVALVPRHQRWQATFSTYFMGLPPGTSCLWRCVPKGSREAKEASQLPGVRVLDLSLPPGGVPDGPLVRQARTGRVQATDGEKEFGGPGSLPEGPFHRSASATRPAAVVLKEAMLPSPPSVPMDVPSKGRKKTSWLVPFFAGIVVAVIVGMLIAAGLTATTMFTIRGYQADLKGLADKIRNKEQDRDKLDLELQGMKRQADEAKQARGNKSTELARFQLESAAAHHRAFWRKVEAKLAERKLDELKQQGADGESLRRRIDEMKRLLPVLAEKTKADDPDANLGRAISTILEGRREPHGAHALPKREELAHLFDRWAEETCKEYRSVFDEWNKDKDEQSPPRTRKRIEENWPKLNQYRNKGGTKLNEEEKKNLDQLRRDSRALINKLSDILFKHHKTIAPRFLLARDATVIGHACKVIEEEKEKDADLVAKLKNAQQWLRDNQTAAARGR